MATSVAAAGALTAALGAGVGLGVAGLGSGVLLGVGVEAVVGLTGAGLESVGVGIVGPGFGEGVCTGAAIGIKTA